MRAGGWVALGAGLLLVVGVLGVRGTSAADPEDLRAAAPPSAGPTDPSPTDPSPTDGEPGQALLSADGLDGMRLGEPATGLVSPGVGDGGELTGDDLPGGCVPAYEAGYPAGTTWDSQAWLVDDVVASVVLVRRNPDLATSAGLRTWLGPTLGSPVQAASELPGARTRTERPLGEDGPEVTVVVVPTDGVEVVFSDAAFELGAVPAEARGRVTTIEVRDLEARTCSQEALSRFSLPTAEGPAPAPVLDLDGFAAAPIGSTVAVPDAVPGALPMGGDGAGCQAFGVAAEGGGVQVVAVDGAVASASVWGDVDEGSHPDLPFSLGMSAEQVSAAVPDGVQPRRVDGTDSVEVTLGERVVEAQLRPRLEWVDDVEVPVTGGPPAVFSVTVRDAAVPQERVLC